MMRYGVINFQEAGVADPGVGAAPLVAASPGPTVAPPSAQPPPMPVASAAPAPAPTGNLLADALAPDPKAPAPVDAPVPVPNGQEWKAALNDLKDDPSLSTFQSVYDLAKSYLNARKAIGADKITLPTKHATKDEWKQVFHKLGLPQKVEEYEVDVPKEAGFQDGFVSELKKAAYEAGVLPQAFNQLLAKYSELNGQAVEKYKQDFEAESNQKIQQLQQQWGQAFESKLRYAKNVAKAFGTDPQVKTFLEDMGGDADFIKFLSMIGEKFFKEDTALSQGVDQNMMSPEIAASKLHEIYGNMQHPYFIGPTHPGYESAKNEVTRLSEMAYGIRKIPLGQFIS